MAGNSLGTLSAKVALNTVDFQKNIQAMKRELKLAQSETKLAGQGIVGYGSSATAGAAKLEGLTKQIGIQRQALGEYNARYEAAVETQGRGSAAAQNAAIRFNEATSEISRLEGEYESLSREIALGNDSFYRAGTSLQSFSEQGMKSADTAMAVGKKWSVAGAAVGAVALVGAKAAIDYESAFASVTKTVDGTTAELDKLSDGIRQMALEVPTSAADLAELAAVAGQLGIKTENIESFTRTIADLGVATNLSGEEGASMLAKFANITKMDQGDFSRLGSSIVELGNNFATTEADITAMAMRLAGAGNQVGMSEADILGLSAALSSVGIEAEMGGSAISKIIVQMQLASAKGQDAFKGLQEVAERNGIAWESVSAAVANGGKELTNMSNSMGLGNKGLAELYKNAGDAKASLEDFGYVAGMTGDDFAKAFQEDAVGALGAFIEGLGNASEKGTTAIEMLDNMGISEVRLRDAMLRAGGASELFAGAIETSNKAWGENTALTDEAETRYETMASKIQLAKNKITDLAIEFGAQLLPALADALEASEPLIESIKNMVKSFTEASPATKKFILAVGGIAVFGGPALMGVAGLTKGVLGLSKGISSTLITIGRYRTGTLAAQGATTALTGALGATSSAAAAGTAQVGALGASTGLLPALISPVGLAIAGVSLALGAGAIAWTVWGKDAYESSSRVKRWGSDVGKEADTTLTKFQSMSRDSQTAMDEFAVGVEGSGTRVTEATKNMMTEIETSAKITKKSIQDIIDKLPESAQEAAKKNAENLNGDIDAITNIADEAGAQINRIYEKHAKEGTKLTDAENQLVLANRKLMINQELEILNISGKDKKNVLSAVNSDIENMTWQQAQKQLKIIDESISKEKTSYEKQLDNLKEARDSNLLTEKQFSAEKEKLDQSHVQMSDKLIDNYIETARKAGDTELEIKKKVMRLGNMTIKEAASRLEKSTEDVVKSNKTIIESTTDMSQKTIEANQTWNALVFDEKTGEVKTNLRDVITEASNSEEGWKNLKFIIKNAKLSTNSKEEMAKALIANGSWEKLTFKEKKALVKSNIKGIVPEILDAKGEWDKIEDQSVKDMLIASNSKEEIASVLADADLWDKLDWSEKKLFLDSNAKETTLEFLETSGKWAELTFEQKKAIIQSDGEKELAETMLRLGLWNELPIESKELLVKDKASLPIIKAIEDVGVWDQLSPKVQTAIVEAKGEDELFDIIQRYGVWEKLDEPTKQLLIDSSSADSKLRTTSDLMNEFNGLGLEPKKPEIEDTEANRKLNNFNLAIQGINESHIEKKTAELNDEASTVINNLTGNVQLYNAEEIGTKAPIINTEDANQKIEESKTKLNEYDATNPLLKYLQANNVGIMGPTQDAKGALLDLDATNPATKILTGDNSNVKGATNESTNLITGYNQYNPNAKYFKGDSNAAAVGADISGLNSAWDTTLKKPEEKKFTVKTFFEKIGEAVGFEKGTNFHQGGPAIVNDQKGANFKELVIEPNGRSYVPEGRDVLLNLPRGSKVIPAGQTKNLIPRYKDGVGTGSRFRNMSDMLIPFKQPVQFSRQQTNNGNTNNDALIATQESTNNLLKELRNNATKPVSVMIGNEVIMRALINIFDQENGTRIEFAEGRIIK
ncbi:phage tail tape measure protein [Carnobacterium maltaromaticum]|uniref:phage tail tape measure protein n=1 Tax=Carnobacterium maltaromaticum TaxID=2751 RepID=UPI0010732022|nr:phage tail tape measure protein [Carnobacterium maltaromaticum]TFJ56034.1 phage tail tape measure protein [Carnobacterium maltaromaticum]